MSNSTKKFYLFVKQIEKFLTEGTRSFSCSLSFKIDKKNSGALRNFKGDTFKYAIKSNFISNFIVAIFSLFLGLSNVQKKFGSMKI